MMLQFSYPLALSYHLHFPLPQFIPHTLHHIIQYYSQSRAKRVLFWLHAPRSYMLWNTFMMFSNSPFSVWDQPRPASLSRQSTLNLKPEAKPTLSWASILVNSSKSILQPYIPLMRQTKCHKKFRVSGLQGFPRILRLGLGYRREAW